MRPTKTMIIALVLAFVFLSVSSTVARDGTEIRTINDPSDGSEVEDPTGDGDPWQDDDDIDPNTVRDNDGGGLDIMVIPHIGSFFGIQVKIIRVNLPAKAEIQKTPRFETKVKRELKTTSRIETAVKNKPK